MRRSTCLWGLALFITAPQLKAETIGLPLKQWTFESKGNFTGRIDRRDLYQIVHPMEPAAAGDFGRVETQVTVPRGATPPYTLQFYVSDNIYGQGHGPGSWRDVRAGHRFKEVLVDRKVVWSQDIAVNLPRINPCPFFVDITENVRGGRSFTLAFQLRQDVDSSTRMPGDRVRLRTYAGTTNRYAPLPYESYATQSYWGDAAVHTGPPPTNDVVCRWQPSLKATGVPASSVRPAVRERAAMRVEKSAFLQGPWAWPVSQGIPLPMGALKDTQHIALFASDNRPVPAGFTPLSRWHDGTLRWVLADFALPAGASADWRLEWGREVTAPGAAPGDPVRTSDDPGLSNGLIRVQWTRDAAGAPRELRVSRVGGGVVIDGQQLYMTFKDKVLKSKWLRGECLSQSKHRAELQVTGELTAEDGDRYGSCRLRVAAFAGSPLIRLLVTIVNERTDAAPESEHETLRPSPSVLGSARPLTAVITSYGLRLRVPGAQPRETGRGWLSIAGKAGGVATALRYFKHIWPVGLAAKSGAIDFQLFKPGDKRMPTYGTYCGAAKTHEIWLPVTDTAVADETAANLAQQVETPPQLDTSALIRNSFAWGVLPAVNNRDHRVEYTHIVERYLDSYYASTRQDLRHYGGYSGSNNFYWNRLHSIYMLYAMTGDRKWFDWAERSSRHYYDICTLNWWPDGSKVGAKIRNTDRFLGVYLLHQNPHQLFDHWNMTGDPDGLRLGRANADFIMGDERMRSGTDGNSARAQGWPLMAMVRAWQETGDQRYMDHAKHIVDVAIGYMEDRRGAYLQRHGLDSHKGVMPFMTGVLCTGLRQYHFWTGDRRAAVALVQNAEAMVAEMHDPARSLTKPYLDYYYSPTPYLRKPDGKTPIAHLNPNIASAQAYAAWLTRDAALADIAWRTWQAYIKVRGWTSNSYDFLYDFPAALYWLDKAPVPDRADRASVPRMWGLAASAPEIWLKRPDGKPFTAQVRWSVYEPPYHCGLRFPQWPDYCGKHAPRGEVRLLGPDDKPVASVPMDLAAHPNGTSVTLNAGPGKPGFHRIVSAGAEGAPINLVLWELSERVERWGVPIDRGWTGAARAYWFRVPEGRRSLLIRHELCTPRHNVLLRLEGPNGKVIEPTPQTSSRPCSGALTWGVELPTGSAGQLWSLKQTPPSCAVLRMDGIGPLAGMTADAFFEPAEVPRRLLPETTDAPPGWTGKVAVIESGKRLTVPRGKSTGDGTYEHIHAPRGTIEFWMRADTSDDTATGLSYMGFGRLYVTRRKQFGTYLKLGEGFLQSRFLVRPYAWYHLAITWELGDESHAPDVSLLVGGVPVLSHMQTRLPRNTGDWTADALWFGSGDPMRIAGLRISSVRRDEELAQGLFSPPPDANTLHHQDRAPNP